MNKKGLLKYTSPNIFLFKEQLNQSSGMSYMRPSNEPSLNSANVFISRTL